MGRVPRSANGSLPYRRAYRLGTSLSLVLDAVRVHLAGSSRNKHPPLRPTFVLLLQQGLHPEAEIDKVTTPQGCTVVGLNEMEHRGFSSALIKGVTASYRKIYNIKEDAKR